jgi:hypothetical protein
MQEKATRGSQNWQPETSSLNKVDVLVQHDAAIVQRGMVKDPNVTNRRNLCDRPKVARRHVLPALLHTQTTSAFGQTASNPASLHPHAFQHRQLPYPQPDRQVACA